MPIVDSHIHIAGAVRPKTLARISNEFTSEKRTEEYFDKLLCWEKPEAWEAIKFAFLKPAFYEQILTDIFEANSQFQPSTYRFIFNASSFIGRGLSIEKTFSVIERTISHNREIEVQLYLGVNKNKDIRTLFEAIDIYAQYHKKYQFLKGIDINGDEEKYSILPFHEGIVRMSRESIPFSLHAGEILKSTHSIENLKYAIRAKPERIGHAIVAGLDKSVFNDLVSSHIPIDLCPVSNLITNGNGIKEYLVKTIKLFAKSGVEFSLGSDDPSFFKTTIYDQYQFLKNECQVDLLE